MDAGEYCEDYQRAIDEIISAAEIRFVVFSAQSSV